MNDEQTPQVIELKSLKGFFLAASPAMGDPRFAETLIFMVHHEANGGVGFVINHPADNISFYSLLEQLEIDNPEGVTDHLIFNGGPVQANNGFVLYEGTMGLRDEAHVLDQIYFSRSLESLKRIGEGRGPDRYSICLGRAEWAPGQLEEELKENAWLPTKANADLIFGDEPEGLWSQVLNAQGISAINFTRVAGHA